MSLHTISIKHGVEGPKHDPWAYTDYTFTKGNQYMTLHRGLGTRLTSTYYDSVWADGAVVTEGELVKKFEEWVGMDIDRFEKVHDRLHPHFDDPMGNPSDFI